MNKEKIIVIIFGTGLTIAGTWIMFANDWRMALGISLLMWGNNMGINYQHKNDR